MAKTGQVVPAIVKRCSDARARACASRSGIRKNSVSRVDEWKAGPKGRRLFRPVNWKTDGGEVDHTNRSVGWVRVVLRFGLRGSSDVWHQF